MKRSILFVLAPVASAAILACYTGDHVSAGGPESPVVDTAATAVADLPCDVAQLLTDNCASCHGTTPSGGTRLHLVSAADLRTNADKAVARMKDAANPMPPDGLLPASSVAVLESWVSAGMPDGTCSVAGGADTNTPSVCTSNTRWTRGNRGSSSMRPGQACLSCHAQSGGDDAPTTGFAGTVYQTAHEPDDCNGVNGKTAAVQVVITDAAGKTFTLTPNSVGNFYRSTAFKPPYTAKVIANGKTRAMKTPQRDGDCNACHTERGAESAPGRIFLP
jgi:mono/diheme cytochrome c family protein